MYYDDEDEDPYAPRIGPAAMPSPRSKFAPYFSGCTDTLEDFLEEFEGLAYDCVLTDPQRVDVIIRYVAPSLRDFWRSLNGFRSCDWPLFRQSLINVFGSTTPRPQVMRQRLLNYVQDSSRTRMDREDDVLQYYRQFLCYSAPLVHSGHLTEEDRDAAFWYGFHHEDRQVLQPRLLGKNPFQPSDIPFHFEDVFVCARGAFAYGNPFPPWLHEQQFQSSTVRCERSVAKHGSRDTYGLQEMSRAVTSNAETTGNLDELPSPPQSTPHPQFPSSSPSVLESQHGLAHSATLDQPGPAPMLSTTLRPSASSPSHTSSPVHPATDNDLIPAYTFPITTSTLPPSVSPTPSHDSSLAHSAADENPESTFPSPSIMPAPFSIPMSNFECLSSAMVDQPEYEPEHAPLSLSTPTLPSPPSPSSALEFTDDVRALSSLPLPEISTLDSLLLILSPDQSLSSSGSLSQLSSPCEFESTPVSVADITQLNSEPPEFSESESSQGESIPFPPVSLEAPPIAPISPHSTPSQRPPGLETFDSDSSPLEIPLAPANLAPSPSTFVLLPIFSASSDLSSASPSPSLVLGDLGLEFSPTPSSAVEIVPLSSPELSESTSSLHEPFPFLPASPEASPNAPISPHLTLSQRTPGLETFDSDSSPPEIAPVPANLAPSPSTFILPVFPASSDLPSASPFSSFVLGPGLESSTVNIAPRSSLESSLSSLSEFVLHLPSPLELIPPHSLPLRRLFGVMSTSPVSTPLEVYEAPSIMSPGPALALRPSLFHSSGSLRRTPAHFGFALALVTMAVLILTFLNVSKTLSTFARKLWSKNQDTGNSQNGIPKARNIPAQRLRLGQLTTRGTRLVFDPGGQSSSSSVQVSSFGTRRRSPAQVEDMQRLRHHAPRHPSRSHSSQ